MELIKPTTQYEESWRQGIKEFEGENIPGWNAADPLTSLDEYMKTMKQYENNENLPEGRVPATTYWLIDQDQFIGHINIRHKLNKALEKFGGHIGYSIRPSKQGQGYGTKMLELGLQKAKELGIEKVLLTTDPDNYASQKVITKNQGSLQDVIEVDGREVNRYWIELV